MDYSKATLKVYDRHANQFAEYAEGITMQYYANKFVSYLKGKKILDAGCGSGRDVRYFAGDGYKAVGIDMSIGMLKEATARGVEDYALMDMLRLGFKAKAFDGVWCCASILHLKKKDVHLALAEFHRVLKSRGILFLAVKEGQGEGFTASSAGNPGKKKYYAFYEQIEIEEKLDDAGFEILTVESSKEGPYTFLQIFARKQPKARRH